ncbi:hypothetical protein FE257_011608 [Aspergillus nanangensis]|uniref:Heterokaryon incompatibility domain-containing protein n=1 Tax=Aspergillus nanangensis TaxID=2582783 RepID=A0AAD4GXX7_ASPNN|nr:hypothetical protein FE257_011608 [Aspergillus nanangensis]
MHIPSKLCQRCSYQNEAPYGNFASLCRDELPRSHRVTIPLDSLQETLDRENQCTFCHLVVSAISAAWAQSPPPSTIDGKPVGLTLCNRVVGVVAQDGTTLNYSENFAANDYQYSICRLVIECQPAPPGCPSEAELQAVDSGPGIKGIFDDKNLFSRRSSDRLRVIDFDLVKGWLNHCRTAHGAQCEVDPVDAKCNDAYADSFRMIDVKKLCIVDAKPSDSYAALSYVWGRAKVLQLVKANTATLYAENAFGAGDLGLPKTIQDAIKVVRKLEIPYLWVDALCIMQDDLDEKARVIGEMDLVYSRAALTIVAASGSHANTGIPGLKMGDREIAPFEKTASIPDSDYQLRVARQGSSGTVARLPWNGRGWTYQERLCSHRLLVFTEQQAFYWCGKAAWCEDTVLETDSPNVYYGEKPLHTLNVPNDKTDSFMKDVQNAETISMFEEYCKIVDEYTSRNLSFPSDIQDAFTGALRRFQINCEKRGTKLEFLFGLPSIWLELSMRWNHLPRDPKYERRKTEIRAPTGAMVPVPSWSWMGWTGGVEMGRSGITVTFALEAAMQPEVKWFYLDERGTSLQHVPTSASNHPRPAWFKTSTSPRVFREQWKQPDAPIDVVMSDLASFNPQALAGKLAFHTSTAVLSLVEHNLSLSTTKYVTDYNIGRTAQGSILLDPEWVISRDKTSFEFIVLSRSVTDDWQDPGKCDSLVVMLVDRQDGIAYRVAVGSIPESAWIEESPTWGLVVLG